MSSSRRLSLVMPRDRSAIVSGPDVTQMLTGAQCCCNRDSRRLAPGKPKSWRVEESMTGGPGKPKSWRVKSQWPVVGGWSLARFSRVDEDGRSVGCRIYCASGGGRACNFIVLLG